MKSKRPIYHFDPAKLIARRKHLGKTQAEIAERAHLPQPNYARMEAGHNNPTLDTAVRVARALGCLVEDLIAE